MLLPSLQTRLAVVCCKTLPWRRNLLQGGENKVLKVISRLSSTSLDARPFSSSSVSLSSSASLNQLKPSSKPNNNNSNNSTAEVLQFLRLNNLTDNPGAVHQKRRKGRGIGSSKGKTCGRGHKGQKAREQVPKLFEGGQTKFYKLLPKRGFSNKRHKAEMVPLNLGTLQMYIDMGRVRPSSPDKVLTLYDLMMAGIFKSNAIKHGVKLMGEGSLKQPIRIHVSRASSSAIQGVEQVGGQVTTVHYNRLALQQLLHPQRFDVPGGRRRVRNARPPPKWQPYYTSWKHRGYLHPRVQMRQFLEQHPQHQGKFDELTQHLNLS